MSNQITLATAITWTTKWRSDNSKSSLAKAFLIPAEDLVGILIEMKILTSDGPGKFVLDSNKMATAGIRSYMATDMNEQIKTNQNKLVLVGTTLDENGDHIDIILNPNDKNSINSGIYDFTNPCPSYCDPNSPLNK